MARGRPVVYRRDICVPDNVMLSGPGLVLGVLTSLFWGAAYLLIIARARRDRIYGMPVVALCGNLSWEIINSFTKSPVGSVRPFPIIGVLIDAVIAWQVVKYGPAQFPRLSKRLCYGFFGLTLSFAFVATFQLNKVFAGYYRDHWGVYTGFAGALMMAALFLSMFYSRASTAGQSVPIAVCMLLGNLSAGLMFLLYPSPEIIVSTFLACLIGGTFILNLLYVVVLLRFSGSRRNEHIGARSPSAG
jgi:hypothetical protein